jgi:hypothetical protein
VNGKRFAHLTVSQIRERIEKASYKLLGVSESEGTTRWSLTIEKVVMMYCSNDPNLVWKHEIAWSQVVGASARDGSCMLLVRMPKVAEARLLLDQIAR